MRLGTCGATFSSQVHVQEMPEYELHSERACVQEMLEGNLNSEQDRVQEMLRQ